MKQIHMNRVVFDLKITVKIYHSKAIFYKSAVIISMILCRKKYVISGRIYLRGNKKFSEIPKNLIKKTCFKSRQTTLCSPTKGFQKFQFLL